MRRLSNSLISVAANSEESISRLRQKPSANPIKKSFYDVHTSTTGVLLFFKVWFLSRAFGLNQHWGRASSLSKNNLRMVRYRRLDVQPAAFKGVWLAQLSR
jgi:hypothetical protein